MSRALDLINAQKAAGATHRAIAEKVGYSHTAITLFVNGKYKGGTARLEARIVEVYSRIPCPFLTRDIAVAECVDYRTKACPTSSPMAVRHWAACKRCMFNPVVDQPVAASTPADTARPALKEAA